MRAQLLHAERAGQRCGLAGIERYDAVLELVEVTGGAVVHDRDNSRRQTLAIVRYLGGNGDFAVVQHCARGDGDIRPRKLLLVLGYQRLVGYLGVLTGCRCAVVLDIENAGTGSAGDVEEVALLVVGDARPDGSGKWCQRRQPDCWIPRVHSCVYGRTAAGLPCPAQ